MGGILTAGNAGNAEKGFIREKRLQKSQNWSIRITAVSGNSIEVWRKRPVVFGEVWCCLTVADF